MSRKKEYNFFLHFWGFVLLFLISHSSAWPWHLGFLLPWNPPVCSVYNQYTSTLLHSAVCLESNAEIYSRLHDIFSKYSSPYVWSKMLCLWKYNCVLDSARHMREDLIWREITAKFQVSQRFKNGSSIYSHQHVYLCVRKWHPVLSPRSTVFSVCLCQNRALELAHTTAVKEPHGLRQGKSGEVTLGMGMWWSEIPEFRNPLERSLSWTATTANALLPHNVMMTRLIQAAATQVFLSLTAAIWANTRCYCTCNGRYIWRVMKWPCLR